MAQQATKGKQIWNTIDHTDKVACQSCHIPEFARVNPTKMSWDRALGKGQEAVGLPFSGRFDFVETTYVFPITHMVAPKENTLACTECHSRQNSRLANLGGFYMPGRDWNNWLDILGWMAVLGALAGVVLHGAGRIFTNGKNGKNNKTAKTAKNNSSS